MDVEGTASTELLQKGGKKYGKDEKLASLLNHYRQVRS